MPRKPRAFRCVGGPFDGDYKTWDDVYKHQPRSASPRYFEYNAAGAAPFSMIFVWLVS